jgi:hypothetical protein
LDGPRRVNSAFARARCAPATIRYYVQAAQALRHAAGCEKTIEKLGEVF